jgi:hypothetical protein
MEQIIGVASLSGSLSLQVNEVRETSYNELNDLPTINGVLVKGNLTQEDLKIKTGNSTAKVDPEDSEHIIIQ